jgi:hypothetical protein
MVFVAQFEVGRGKRARRGPIFNPYLPLPHHVYLNTIGNTSNMCVICGEAKEPYKSFSVNVCVIVISRKGHEFKLLI